MEIENTDDVVDYDIENGNMDYNNLVPDEYFVIPEHVEKIDDILLEKFDELGIKIKYHYASTGVYCVKIKNQESLDALASLEYITLEQVRKIKALGPGD
jgi:hypothetical protein